MKRAAVLVALGALVACKADLHHTTDAQPLDAPVDTLAPGVGEPPANAVKILITRIGVPQPGIAVFFQPADSSVAGQSLTNDAGLAWAVMPAGGFVTAREHTGQAVEMLTTFATVQHGELVTLDLAPTGSTASHTVQLTVPAAAGAASYQIYAPCGHSAIASATEDVTLVGCDSVTDLVIEPRDADDNVLGVLFAPSVTVGDNAVQINGAYSSLRTVSLAYSNVPAFVSFVGIYEGLSASRRAFGASDGVVPAGMTAQATVQMPPSTGTELTATNLMPVSGQVGIQSIYHWHPADIAYDLDVSSVLLPPYSAAPAFDPATRTLAWGETAGSIEPDVIRARIHVTRDEVPLSHTWIWRIVAPRTATHVTFPKLPIVDYDFNAAAGDTITVDELTTFSVPGSFVGFHTHGFDDVRATISGTLGRIVEQDLYFESL